MSAFTFADNKLGGRLTAVVDAIGAGHLNRAAGILAELADELNVEATATGLLSEEAETPAPAEPKPPALVTQQPSAEPIDMQMCARNVHSYAAPDSNGWRHCQICGMVNVAPPDNNGFVEMSARQ